MNKWEDPGELVDFYTRRAGMALEDGGRITMSF